MAPLPTAITPTLRTCRKLHCQNMICEHYVAWRIPTCIPRPRDCCLANWLAIILKCTSRLARVGTINITFVAKNVILVHVLVFPSKPADFSNANMCDLDFSFLLAWNGHGHIALVKGACSLTLAHDLWPSCRSVRCLFVCLFVCNNLLQMFIIMIFCMVTKHREQIW